MLQTHTTVFLTLTLGHGTGTPVAPPDTAVLACQSDRCAVGCAPKTDPTASVAVDRLALLVPGGPVLFGPSYTPLGRREGVTRSCAGVARPAASSSPQVAVRSKTLPHCSELDPCSPRVPLRPHSGERTHSATGVKDALRAPRSGRLRRSLTPAELRATVATKRAKRRSLTFAGYARRRSRSSSFASARPRWRAPRSCRCSMNCQP